MGATIYTLLSSVIPIDAIARNLELYDEDPLLPLYMLNEAIPVALSDVIEKAMSQHSKDRYATVEEFWQVTRMASTRHPQTEPIASDPQLPIPTVAEISKPGTSKLDKQADKPEEPLYAPRPHFIQRHFHAYKKLLSYTLYALLACIILEVALASFLLRPAQSPEKPKPPEAACIAENLTPIDSNRPMDLPSLFACYAGTVSISGISNSKTNLFLFHIQQSQETITGACNGFGTIGTFSGSVTKAGTISFTVKLENQERPLRFEGMIGSAGELVINYSDLDQNGHKTQNEYGAGRLRAFTSLDLTPTAAASAQKQLP